jgi:hypothetical protein
MVGGDCASYCGVEGVWADCAKSLDNGSSEGFISFLFRKFFLRACFLIQGRDGCIETKID